MKKSKKILITFFLVFLVIFLLNNFLFKNNKNRFSLTEVKKGTIKSEITETGQVKFGDKINLSFEGSGKIKKIYVKVGDFVKKGQLLAELDVSSEINELNQIKAQRKMVEANFEKLLKGPSKEDILLAKYKVTLEKEKVKSLEENYIALKQVCAKLINSIEEKIKNQFSNIYLDLDQIIKQIDRIYQTYFYPVSLFETSKKVKDDLNNLIDIKNQLKEKINDKNAKTIDLVPFFKEKIKKSEQLLSDIREITDDPYWKNKIYLEDKNLIDSERKILQADFSTLSDLVESYKLQLSDNNSKIVAAENNINLAKNELKIAEEELNKLLSPPRKEDIDYYKAELSQIDNKIALLNNKIKKSKIFSPKDALVVNVYKKEGELVNSMVINPIITILAKESPTVEVDIPEVNIGDLNIGDICEIELDAFLGKKFEGKVVEIDPAETIISGVVYYKTKIEFENLEKEFFEKIKPGMTANVTIITQKKENVLYLPERAIIEENGKKYVRIPFGSKFKKIKVETGLETSDGNIEIKSKDLKEGDKVILFIKD